MPMVVFAVSPEETYWSVRSAIENGVRHIDTVEFTGMEKQLVDDQDAGVPRSELFVATKISSGVARLRGDEKLIARQLDDLGTTCGFVLYSWHATSSSFALLHMEGFI